MWGCSSRSYAAKVSQADFVLKVSKMAEISAPSARSSVNPYSNSVVVRWSCVTLLEWEIALFGLKVVALLDSNSYTASERKAPRFVR